MPYKLVIFDFDGTLADSFPWFLSVLNGVALKYGFQPTPPEMVDELRTLGSREILKRMRVSWWKLPFIASHMRELKRGDAHNIELFPDVPRLLASLKAAGIRVAIVSSDSEANVRQTLGPVADNIDHFECSSSLFGKRAKFRKVLRLTKTAASDAIAVGDEVRDAEAAMVAGVSFGAVTWGYAAVEALRVQRPDYMFQTVEDIAKKLID